MNYTPRELMVVCAARQIRDGENVFVGMRLPLLAFALAKLTHAPDCVGLFETGTMRDAPASQLLYTMGDAPNIADALWTTSTRNVLGVMAAGEVQLGFIGGAEIDRYGNLNTSVIGDWQQPKVRLPGSGGGADIASLAQRLAIIMPHERHRLREKVDFVTSPGYGYPDEQGSAGQAWRKRVGLPRGGPAALITTLAVFTFDPESGEALLQSYHPGTSIEQVQEQTGWQLRLAPDCRETEPPSAEELRLIRSCDPEGVWTS
ncbi:CoA-transferase [Ktedonosporobacter rubrisoli]|uniref:CoA-transferase n=1 Tax=Ktedonosporobacter rubrisoli TaxID=2509675 RepID=A0A4P6JX01_KTERU|nr:CoA-transferase [Ktedonosporobacter rubrisoli]QBD80144.1 CoA-transferase [Ktedonosporobacter rubrisoli]